MSDKVRALVWDFYDEKRFGAPRILALALSDVADDRGGGISESVANLSRKTEQTRRAIQLQMARLELSGLLICEERSAGGPGQFNKYRLNLSLFFDHANGERRSLLTANVVRCLDDPNGERGSLLADAPITTNKDYVRDSGNSEPDDIEDQRLAGWMFERIKALNPKHREPNYKTWRRDLRLTRERDARTRREIAALFAWANADSFWQANILCPGTLREKWDTLEMHRRRAGGGGPMVVSPTAGRCCWDTGGAPCAAPIVVRLPDGREFCRPHSEEEERERARAQA